VTDPGGGNFGVTDTGSGATVSVGAGCAPDGSGGALCPTAGLTAISASDPSGSNTVTIASTIALAATLSGGSDHDALTGGTGNDTIDGNGGETP
jgi:Ca2+-binding RTX toxin-like protein